MSKFFLYLLLAIVALISIVAAAPYLIILVLIAWSLSLLLPKFFRKLDVNRDGSINFDDLTALFSNSKTSTKEPGTAESFVQSRMRAIWGELEHQFVLLSIEIQKRERSSRGWWRRIMPFGHDAKVTGIITNLASELNDRELHLIRADFIDSVNELRRLDRQLADIRASIAMKSEPEDGPQHRAAAKIEQAVSKESSTRQSLLNAFQSRMIAYRVVLSPDQAEVLLSRVDAGDVTKMTTVFAIISSITSQFADAKIQSGENLDVTKKYYGIYLGLLELQIHIQTEYIEKVDTVYLPGVQDIGNGARNLLAETEVKMGAADDQHKEGYRQNIKSQQFTIEVTEIYSNALRSDRSKVDEARNIVSRLHELAENTLSTVRVSADLSSLVQQGEGLYKQVMSLQTPELVPFENLKMQREFEEVTQRLRTA